MPPGGQAGGISRQEFRPHGRACPRVGQLPVVRRNLFDRGSLIQFFRCALCDPFLIPATIAAQPCTQGA